MPLLGDPAAPTFIHLPDHTVARVSAETGDKIFEQPGFDYFLLRRATAWACPGYSSALLVMWEHRPDKIEVCPLTAAARFVSRFLHGMARQKGASGSIPSPG